MEAEPHAAHPYCAAVRSTRVVFGMAFFVLLLCAGRVEAKEIEVIEPTAAIQVHLPRAMPWPDALAAAGEQANVAIDLSSFSPQKSDGDFDVREFKQPPLFWELMGRAALRANAYPLREWPGVLAIYRGTGRPLGYAVTGPGMLVLHYDKADRDKRSALRLTLHYHWLEMERPEMSEIVFVSKSGKTTAAEFKSVNEKKGNAEWESPIDAAALDDIASVECKCRCTIRPQLFRLAMPLAAKSVVESSAFSAKSVESSTDPVEGFSERFEVSWRSNLAPATENRLNDILQRKLKGSPVSPEESKLFKRESQKAKRFAIVEIEGVFDKDKKEVRPMLYGGAELGISRSEFHIAFKSQSERGCQVSAVIGLVEQRTIDVKIAIVSRP